MVHRLVDPNIVKDRPLYRGRVQPLFHDDVSWCLLIADAGRPTRFDTDDLARIARCWWSFTSTDKKKRYPATRTGLRAPLRMHHLVLGDPPHTTSVAEHVNGDRLDNRRTNLRWVTKSQTYQQRRITLLPPSHNGAYDMDDLALPGPTRTYRSLHLRVRSDIADKLAVIADLDTQRTDRRIYVAELHRSAVSRYIQQRTEGDPEVAAAIEASCVDNSAAILERVNGAEA